MANITGDGATLDKSTFVPDSTDTSLKESVTYAANSWNSFDYYAAEAKTDGYKINGTKLINVTASGVKAFTISGAKTTDGITVNTSKKTVTLSAGNLNGKNVTITGGKGKDNTSLQKAATIIYGVGDDNDTANYVKGMQISLSGAPPK